MTVREHIYNLITTDTQLNALGINAASTFTGNTLDTPQIRPFCVLRWSLVNPGLRQTREGGGLNEFPVNQRILQVWVHDEWNAGDYTRIDRSLFRLRTLLTSVEGAFTGEPGTRLTAINWEGDSEDLSDDMMRTITRNAQFRLTGSAI